MKKKAVFVLALVLLAASAAAAAGQEIKPVTVGGKMPDFTLSDADGKMFSMSGLEGRNVLLVFPRGKVGDHWCQICHYQYAELAKLELERGLREKYGLEIVFVLPYGRDEVKEWLGIFPSQMDVIEGWKNPSDDRKDDERYQRFVARVRKAMPLKFDFSGGDVPLPFPVLADSERKLSEGLGLFRTEWDGSKVDQNVATIFLIDGKGTVRFKYFGQSTWDRPDADYIIEVLEKMM